MKGLLWLGIFFLSASWLFFIPQFTIPDPSIGLVFVVCGVLCMVGALCRIQPIHLDIAYMFLLIPLAPALILLSFPYNLGLLVLAVGLFSYILLCHRQKLQAISFGILLSAIILLFQSLLFPLYVSFVAHGHRVDILAVVISPITNLLGLSTSTNNGLLFIQTIQQTYPVSVTWEKLGLYLILNMFLGALFLFIALSQKRKILLNTLLFLVTTSIYLIVRFVGILFLYTKISDLSLFWNPLFTALSFLPLALLLMKLLPLDDSSRRTIQLPSLCFTKKQLLALVMLFLFVFSSIGVLLIHDPGSMKNGRILIDEYHSEWEDTIRPLDTEWYGLLSTYNYYSWAEWLNHYYTVDKNIDSIFTDDLLSAYDILILKCPTAGYSLDEIHAIKQFVGAGGGLYLIGDHTNVFGMNTFLNQISEEFGIRFRNDATYELGTGNLSTYSTDTFFSHPVMRHTQEFEFMTSCTLEPTSFLASLRMENIIVGNRIISEPGTYSTENFFRESAASPDSEFGYLLQAAAIKYGAGRVIAFTDSTVFSSFCMFTDGYPSFTLGVMDYLNRMNSFPVVTIIFLCIGIVSLIVLVALLRNTRKITILWMVLFVGLLAFSSATPLCFYLNGLSYSLPLAHTDYIQVCFEQQHSSAVISVKPTSALVNDKNNFGTFFVWTQRLGCIPTIEKTIKDATEQGDIVVIINPTEPFTESSIDLVTSYLERGGRLLLLDSILNKHSSANQLLGVFGMWLSINTNDELLFSQGNETGNRTVIGNITIPSLSIGGGRQLLQTRDNETYASMTEFINKTTGAVGRVIVIVDSYVFSDVIMGGSFVQPSDRQRRIYNTEFFLLNELVT